jgi:hypothetical protein
MAIAAVTTDAKAETLLAAATTNADDIAPLSA